MDSRTDKSLYWFNLCYYFSLTCAGIIFAIIFLYWSTDAYNKYNEEPISTQIRFRLGDDDKGNVTMPALTVCYIKLKSAAQQLNCGLEAMDFFNFYKQCLFAGVSATDIIMSLSKSPSSQMFVEIHPEILVGQKAKEKQSKFWSYFLHRRYGPCFTYNTKLVPGYETLPIDDMSGNPEFIMTLSGIDEADTVKLLFHSGHDVADAEDLYPQLNIAPNNSYTLGIVKKIIESISTRNNPCHKYPKQTCAYRVFYDLIIDTYGCETIFVSSEFLGRDKAPICNMSVHALIMQNELQHANIWEFSKSCVSKQACIQTKYMMTIDKQETGRNVSTVQIQLIDPIVEYNIDSISYDLQSLIGEVGGTLGLTLGLSGFSITELIFSKVLKQFYTFASSLKYHA